MVGEPIGINIKWWSKKSIDLEAAINKYESFLRSWLLSNSSWLPIKNAWVASVAYPIFPDGFLHVHLDHIWHKYVASVSKVGIIPIHYGFGGRVRFNDENIFGIRGVFGVDLLSEEFPLDFFCELAPIVDLVPKSGLDVNLVVGMRLYFR